MATCLIGLGSNLGDREQQLTGALELLGALPQVELHSVSHFRATRPAGGPQGQGSFLNAAAVLETSLGPPALLLALQSIENDLGRVRTVRWGERVVDLDLLLYDRLELSTPTLELPHPRMSFRRFVLEPAAEIAPDMVYPINGWTIAQLLANLNRPEKYIATEFLSRDVLRKFGELPGVRILPSPDLESADENDLFNRQKVLDSYLTWMDKKAGFIERAHWPATGGWSISDFWYESVQLLSDLHHEPTLVARQSTWRSRVVEPKLVLLPRELRGLELVIAALDRLRRRSETGPVLLLPINDPLRCRDEVLAAMQAME